MILLSLCTVGCTSSEVPSAPNEKDSELIGLQANGNGTETLVLDTGEVILLTDTVTHVVDMTTTCDEDTHLRTRVEPRIESEKGFDFSSIPSKNSKNIYKGLEKYGIDPNTVYISKTCAYYKNLPAVSGCVIVPSKSRYENLTTPIMGFNPGFGISKIGFTTASSSKAGYEDGCTNLIYIVSDASGKSWKKHIPCEPASLIWYFSYAED